MSAHSTANSDLYGAAPARNWTTPVIIGLVLLLVAGGTYWLQQRSQANAALAQAREAARLRRPRPQLTEVPTSAMPAYDGAVARAVAEQLRQVPAAEKTNVQHLRQFRGLATRFWAAQTQSEYLIGQARSGKASAQFAAQAIMVRETWQAWNHAAVYTFNFGPVMKAQFERMGEAASSQQHILANLPDLLPDQQYLTDREMVSRTADVQDLVGGLLPLSPVTGQPYSRTVLSLH